MATKKEKPKKPGRPSKGVRRTLTLRINEDLAESLVSYAKAIGEDSSSYVQGLIRKDLAAQGFWSVKKP